MIDRRSFIALMAGAAIAPQLSWGQSSRGQDLALLLRRSGAHALRRRRRSRDAYEARSAKAPANIQYAWPHVSRRYLYVTSSDSASGIGGFVDKTHHATAFRIDPASGALTQHGGPVPLPSRPIHNATDRKSQYLLTAYNN